MKKIIITLLLTLCISIPSTPAKAAVQSPIRTIEILPGGNYLETAIFTEPDFTFSATYSADKSITKTKLTTCKNAQGTKLWSLSITASFTYNGSSARCTSCTPHTTVYNKTWKVKSLTSSKSGNHATANAIMSTINGNNSSDIHKALTISCSKTGVIS